MKKEVIMKFMNYKVEKISYILNEAYDPEKPSVGFPNIAINIANSEENKNKFNIILGVKYSLENNLPYLVEIVIRGFFETNSKLTSEEEKLQIILSNGSAIMYPYMRALITDITSKSDFSPIILPTINFYDYVSEVYKEKDDFLIDSKFYKEN
jgi:preprotein translocase subunit SecB